MSQGNSSVGVHGVDQSGYSQVEAQVEAQVDAHSIRAREDDRAELLADIQAYLDSGGKITSVRPCLRVDTPRKPKNNYGKESL